MLPKEGYHLESDTWLTAVVVGGLALIAGGSWTYALIQLVNALRGG
jgi:hypothetical protein